MNASLPVTIDDIEVAARRISGRVLTTPLVVSASLTELCGVPVGLKLEHHQTTGSFKLRGATNAVLSLSAGERALGVIAASTGNHGRALAHAAKAEGSVATICMSQLVPVNKVSEIRRLGAHVRIIGRSQDEAQDEVERLVASRGLVMVPPFDHPAIVAGQGTLGVEIVAQMPDVAMVLVPVSGGGLAAGVAAAVKARRPATRVIGLTMERGAAMKAKSCRRTAGARRGTAEPCGFARRRHRARQSRDLPHVPGAPRRHHPPDGGGNRRRHAPRLR